MGSEKRSAKDLGIKDKTEALVLDFLIQKNRPYNSTDLANLLGHTNGLKKTAIQKALNSLSEEDGLVVAKEFGKSTIYFTKQETKAVNKEDVQKLDASIEILKRSLEEKKSEKDKLTSQLNGSTQSMPVAKIKEEIISYTKKNDELRKKLDKMKTFKPLTKSEIEKVKVTYEKYKKMYKQRKGKFTEIYDAMTEHMSKSDMKKLKEEIDYVDDTSTGIDYSKYLNLLK